MRKILLLLGLGLVALTGCKKDSSSLEESLIANLVMPEGPFAPGASVTIQGSGFTSADEIWFRTPTKADGDIQATVTHQAANELTFTVPQVSAGEHAVILKRSGREMTLGKITVVESAKLYAFGGDLDLDNEILWEVDKATGELTEIIKLPDEDWQSESAASPIVDPVSGNIYLYKWTDTDGIELYRVNPNDKTLKKIGLLDQKANNTMYFLCLVDGRLHAMVEKESSKEDSEETFYSLVSINTETAEQTTVADFGSLHQALGIPTDVGAGFFDCMLGLYLYDKTTHSLILTIYNDTETNDCQLVRLDIDNQKIIAGEKFNEYVNLFSKDGKICGAFYDNEDRKHIDFRPIDTKNLTAGNSIGSATLETREFWSTWCYDATTGKGYTVLEFDDSAFSALGTFDFNTQKLEEIKAYEQEIWFNLFQ